MNKTLKLILGFLLCASANSFAQDSDYDIVTITVSAPNYDATKPPQLARVKYNKMCPLVITSDDMGRVEFVRNWAFFNGYPVFKSNYFGNLDDPMTLFNAPYNATTLTWQEPDMAASEWMPLTYTDDTGGQRRFTATSAIMPYKINTAGYTFTNANMAKAMVRTGWSFGQHDVADTWPDNVSTAEEQKEYIRQQLPIQSEIMEGITGYGIKILVEPNGNHNYIGAALATSDISWIIFQNASSDYPALTKSLDAWTTSEQTTFNSKPTGAYERVFFQDGNNGGANDGQKLMTIVDNAIANNDNSQMILGGTHGIGNRVLHYLKNTVQPTDKFWVASADEVWEYYHLYNHTVIDDVNYANGKLSFNVKVPKYAKHQFRELTINIAGIASEGTDCTFSENVVTASSRQNDGQFTINFGLEENVCTHIDQLIALYRANLNNLYLKRDAQYLISLLKNGNTKTTYQSRLDAAPNYSYTVRTSLGTELLSGISDVASEVNYKYPKYQLNDGTLYEAAKNTERIQGTNIVANYVGAFTPESAGQEVTVSYSKSDIGNVTFYSEGEDLGGVTIATQDYSRINENSGVAYALRYASGGAAGEILSPTAVTTLQPGKYTLVAAIGDTHTSATAHFDFKVGDKTVLSLTTEDVKGYIKEYSKEGIIVKTEQPVTIEAQNSSGSFWVDYLYFMKTGEYDATTPDVTLTSPAAEIDATDGQSTMTITASAIAKGTATISRTIIKDSNDQIIAQSTDADPTTCSYTFKPSQVGNAVFTAEATDSEGKTGLSDDLTISVKSDFTLTARSNMGDDVGCVTFTSQTADRSYTYLFPRYLLKGTDLYETEALNTQANKLHYGEVLSFSLANNSIERTINYDHTATNVIFYAEGENISGVRRWTNTTIDTGKGETYALTLGSMGACGALTNAAITTLPAGTYRLTAGIGSTNNPGTWTFNAGEAQIGQFSVATKPSIELFTTAAFTLTEEAVITVSSTNGKDNSQNWLDFVNIEKLGVQTLTIGTQGFTTFSSTYALDFTNVDAIKAYRASTATDGTIDMVQVTGAVPPSTGLLIQGAIGSETATSIPLTATLPQPVGTNLLAAHTSEGIVAEGNYVFSGRKDGTQLGFRRLTTPTLLPAGRAYLMLPQESASPTRLNITIDGEDLNSLGLAPIRLQTPTALPAYNLRGVKASSIDPIIISNGKKHLNK